jgi:hypothetical protein
VSTPAAARALRATRAAAGQCPDCGTPSPVTKYCATCQYRKNFGRELREPPDDTRAIETSGERCACGLRAPCDPETCPKFTGAVGYLANGRGNLADAMSKPAKDQRRNRD